MIRVAYLFVSEPTGMRWVEHAPPIQWRAAAYRAASKAIRDGLCMPFAIPILFNEPELKFVSGVCKWA